MRIALEVLFWIWCLAWLLGVVGFWGLAKSLGGESGGPAVLGMAIACAVVLAVSLLLRFLL